MGNSTILSFSILLSRSFTATKSVGDAQSISSRVDPRSPATKRKQIDPHPRLVFLFLHSPTVVVTGEA